MSRPARRETIWMLEVEHFGLPSTMNRLQHSMLAVSYTFRVALSLRGKKRKETWAWAGLNGYDNRHQISTTPLHWACLRSVILQHSYLYWNMLVLDCEIEEGSTIWQIPLVIIHWNEDNIEFYFYILCPKAWRYWGKTEVGNFIVRILIFYTYCESQRKPSP